MAMPKSTPRRPGNPGQNRDSRDGVFGHPESQFGPLPRVGLYARVSTPHQHTIRMQLRQLREFLERRRWQEVLVVEEVVSGSRRRPERDRLLDAARRREIDIIPSGTYRFRDQRANPPNLQETANSLCPEVSVIRISFPRVFTPTLFRSIPSIHPYCPPKSPSIHPYHYK